MPPSLTTLVPVLPLPIPNPARAIAAVIIRTPPIQALLIRAPIRRDQALRVDLGPLVQGAVLPVLTAVLVQAPVPEVIPVHLILIQPVKAALVTVLLRKQVISAQLSAYFDIFYNPKGVIPLTG